MRMHAMLSTCPVCEEKLMVSRLDCRNCGTTIEGQFEVGALGRLHQEQITFVETFIRCEGKLNRMEKELGMSYPTLRSRLSEVIRTMGYEVGPETSPLSEEDRHKILDDIAGGRISSEEAMGLLESS